MNRNKRRRNHRTETPVWLKTAGMILLAIVAIVLSYLALAGTPTKTTEDSVAETNAVNTDQLHEGGDVERFDEEFSETNPVQVSNLGPVSRLIQANGALVMRAEVGRCDAPGSLSFSNDGGLTWYDSTSFSSTGATQILRLLPVSEGSSFVVAYDTNCVPQIYSTADMGQSWSLPLSAVGTWYLNPATPSTIDGPGGRYQISCDAIGLQSISERSVLVQCADGSLLETSDRGLSWSVPNTPALSVALGSGSRQYLSVSESNERCSGLGVGFLGESVHDSGCFEVDATVDPTAVALSESDSGIIVWFSDEIFVSTDRGMTWA